MRTPTLSAWTSGLSTFFLSTMLSVSPPLQAGTPPALLKDLDQGMAGQRSQVLVLGTVHLREMGQDFKPGSLDRLLERLAGFKPEIITVEDESGEECDLALRHPAKYGEDYCKRPAEAQAATGLDIPAALAEVERTLKSWPDAPIAAQRRRLAALFLAAKESASAAAQWLQLPKAEQHAGDGLNEALVGQLQRLVERPNESIQIAARLAARLGLQRVHPTDDHTGDNLKLDDTKAFVAELEAAWKSEGNLLKHEDERSLAQLKRGDDLLPLYRFINRPEYLRTLARANIVGPMAADSPRRYPQIWVGGWEVRNLRMVANIRETFRERPGARVLSIVGASHKPWFDQWLSQMQGLDLVDALQTLDQQAPRPLPASLP
ncbi:DUF5694 domain-containing protein [Paucibacter sp. DJ1R-11]|uniref:DUF5694 domain-containing protein n=1 Tax=Paucibacter sp. DJ1R-11 TaxID=2893556 RepID=UPI0021E3715D|nr:DUF5694 domain-containing protein [Paucibacter sp. DJ1R-11]MCV2364029.1 DUF5694 domain-containing protein [Paucibacter sp. DJ1R-11]